MKEIFRLPSKIPNQNWKEGRDLEYPLKINMNVKGHPHVEK